MTDWDVLGGDRRAIAPALGPFPHRPFLEAWWRNRGDGSLSVVGHGSSAVAVVTRERSMFFAGDADVTDYHAPVGEDPGGAIAAAVATAPAGTRFRFDSMPEEIARPVAAAIDAAGMSSAIHERDATMVLDPTPGDPLASLDGKQRHELRRKVRRFEESFGEPHLVTGVSGFDAFVAMHRLAEGDKGTFMSAATVEFFRDLLGIPGAVVDLLVTSAGDPVAGAFGFRDAEGYYLYNSSFDPAAGPASPGIVMVELLIERESSMGGRRFDLLKGTETYKRRFGARPRPLFVVEGVV
ncbi:MAG TPA: GNAT family N-acetyltransferase [Acidimicrobiia bacterium]